MNYIGPSYITDIGGFSWNGSEYVYDGWSYGAYVEWDTGLNPTPVYRKVTVTIRVDDQLTAPLQLSIDETSVGELANQTPPGTYELILDIPSGSFGRLQLYFGYAAYSLIGIEFDEADLLTWYDVTAQENYDLNMSGEGPDIGQISQTMEDLWRDALGLFAVDNNPGGYNSAELYGSYVYLHLYKPTLFSKLRIQAWNSSVAIRLLKSGGGMIDLFTYAYGDVREVKTENEDMWVDDAFTTRSRVTWSLDEETLIEGIWLGYGGGGYPQERITAWDKLELDNFIDTTIPPFWTNFKGQFEV